MSKIVIIDGYSLFFRAFYATYTNDKDKLMHNKDGIPTNAIYAFSNMLNSIIKTLNEGDGIFVALDSGKPTFRKEIYSEYKAQRKPVEEELKIQFPILRELLDALNILHYEKDGLEADDIAGTVAKTLEKQNYKIEIFTSDKDYLQLIDDSITIKLIKKGLKDIHEMTPSSFYDEWGFSPYQIIDYKALRGDHSDNLMGIPGVGEKTAKELIQKYKTFDEIVKNADTSKKVGKNIIEYQEQGKLCLSLATIKSDQKLPFETNDYIYKGYNFQKVTKFANKYNLNSLVNKLPVDFRISDTIERINYLNVSSFESIELSPNIGIALDINDDNYHFATLYGMCITSDNKTYYISYDNLIKDEKLLSLLKNEKINKYGFDIKKDKVILNNHNIEINGFYFDLLLASYLIENTLNSSLENVLAYFNVDISYAINDEINLLSVLNIQNDDKTLIAIESYYSIKLYEKAVDLLNNNDAYKLFTNIELPLSLVLAEMECEGFPLNKEKLLQYGENYEQIIKNLESQIYSFTNKEFNINSPKQLAVILYDELKLPQINKSRSTNAETLSKLYDCSPIIPLILEHRKYSKLLHTYVEGYIPFIKNNLVHATFNQALTSTGRLSCSNPNLQNLSVRDDDSKQIRKAFFYDDPSLNLLSLDYSQIELRLLAHLSNSETMINVFNSDEDIHAETAKKIFHLDRNPTSSERRQAKTVNFGIIYGISDWGLSEQLKLPVSESKEIINSFYEEFPEIKTYLDSLVLTAQKKGYSETLFNRRRYLTNINSSNYQEREFEKRAAMNAPIQGSAADLIKIAMIKVSKALKEHNFKAKIINQIHDEIIIKVSDDEKDEVLKLVKNTMENCVKLKVKLLCDGGIAKNWYDCK